MRGAMGGVMAHRLVEMQQGAELRSGWTGEGARPYSNWGDSRRYPDYKARHRVWFALAC